MRAEEFYGLEMLVHTLRPRRQTPGLDGSVPRACLPVVSTLLAENPRRQNDGEIGRDRYGVRFIERSEMI